MGFLCVMYLPEREVDRWPNIDRLPNPKYWTNIHFCMLKQDGNVRWFRLANSGQDWWGIIDYDVPKKIRLLALLE